MSNTHNPNRLSAGGLGLGIGLSAPPPTGKASARPKPGNKAGIPAASPQSKKRAEAAAKAPAKPAKPAKTPELTSGELGGIEWSEDETKDALYQFARDQELDVKSRDGKAEIITALSNATKAQD